MDNGDYLSFSITTGGCNVLAKGEVRTKPGDATCSTENFFRQDDLSTTIHML